MASSSKPLPGEAGQPGRPDQVLTPDQEERALTAMRSVAKGHTPVSPPGPAPRGTRWSDVPAAVAAACDDEGVETVIVETFAIPPDNPVRYRFVLRTIEDWPGELVIGRRDAPGVCEVESVEIGRFPSEPKRQKRAQALVKAFHTHMEALGRKRGFNEESDGATKRRSDEGT